MQFQKIIEVIINETYNFS